MGGLKDRDFLKTPCSYRMFFGKNIFLDVTSVFFQAKFKLL
jgi:hypothetical protein